ncbi:high mobility group B protein 10 isoform X2 [Medicago truncatula]|uniref:high mobility group B protein 10 isoform X2 n=1 Tax=Medicago truncatula TaxID=3880 RepID=UPI001967429E|nr:high mobility group B protein 10-like isoform X2 [Medicago truncatula]
MEGNKTMVPSSSPSDTKLTNGTVVSNDDLEIETFYVKLTEVLDSSGFNLIFNVRETILDLYLFYLEVTRRGGFHQVGLQNKWTEVVSALKLEGNNAMLSAQVEKIYATLLYKFEKLYFYRFPPTGSSQGTLKRKQNLQNSTTGLSQLMADEDTLKVAKLSKDYSSQMTGAGCQEPRVLLQAPSNDKEKKKQDKEKKKRRGPPTGQSGYQIFLKHECARLKAHDPDIDGKKVLRMAVDAWQKMSATDKEPYVEESRKIKEKQKEAMITDNKQKSTEDLKKDEQKSTEVLKKDEKKSTQGLNLKKDDKMPGVDGDDYGVTSQPLPNYSFVNNAAVELAFKMTEKSLKDPFFPVDLDTYCSLNMLNGKSK